MDGEAPSPVCAAGGRDSVGYEVQEVFGRGRSQSCSSQVCVYVCECVCVCAWLLYFLMCTPVTVHVWNSSTSVWWTLWDLKTVVTWRFPLFRGYFTWVTIYPLPRRQSDIATIWGVCYKRFHCICPPCLCAVSPPCLCAVSPPCLCAVSPPYLCAVSPPCVQ